MNNVDLQKLVEEELAYDPRIDEGDIAIVTTGGIVTLRGSVPSLIQKWQSVEVIKNLPGVTGIVDELVVDLPEMHQRTDGDIARALATRLESSAVVPASVKFVVKSAIVTLSGEVPWRFQSEEALREARSLSGVQQIVDETAVASARAPTEEAVRRRLQSVFARVADRAADLILVTVDDATVILRGRVPTWFARDRAAQAVWSFPGVVRLDNRIEVIA